jgi:hypothetical protein
MDNEKFYFDMILHFQIICNLEKLQLWQSKQST